MPPPDRGFKPEWLLVSGKTSALHKACLDGNGEIVTLLLQKGSPLDGRDDQGFTPLLAAASQRHFEIVKNLLEMGANPSLSNESQSSLLHYLIRTEPPLTFAQRDMLKYCLVSGSDVNCRNKFGETPLHQACMRKHVEMCVFLLDSGAKVDMTNKFGETALHKACGTGSLELLKLFVSVGADPTIHSAHGLPRDLLAQSRTSSVELEDMRRLLAEYEATYQAKPVNLLASGEEPAQGVVAAELSDAMQRATLVTGVSQSELLRLDSNVTLRSRGGSFRHASSSAADAVIAGEEVATPPRITVKAFASVGGGSSAPSSPLVPSLTSRQSLDGIDEFPEPGPVKSLGSGRSSPRFGSTRRSKSVASENDAVILSNSPQVSRLLRQPSLLDQDAVQAASPPIFTLDASFRQETSGFGRLDDMHLRRIPAPYSEELYGRDHVVFLSGHGVACVQTEKHRNCFAVIVFDVKGYSRLVIPSLQLEGKEFVAATLNWLSLNVFQNTDIWLVEDDRELKNHLRKIELEAPEASNCFRIGVVYCAAGQTTEAEFFHNPPDIPRFRQFLNLIGEEIDLLGWGGYRGQLSVTAPGTSYYSQYQGAEVMFHVSNLMDGEQQRRLIGNDTALIYFHDSPEPFSSAAPRSVMSQVYAVVKPVGDFTSTSGGLGKLRLGFMSRKTVTEFLPELPINPVFETDTPTARDVLRSFLLAKVLNGYRAATLSPPLDKMLKRPRTVHIEKIVAQYPMSAAKKKHVLKTPKKK